MGGRWLTQGQRLQAQLLLRLRPSLQAPAPSPQAPPPPLPPLSPHPPHKEADEVRDATLGCEEVGGGGSDAEGRGGEGEVGEGMGGEILGLGALDVPLRVTGMCVYVCVDLCVDLCVCGTSAGYACASMRACMQPVHTTCCASNAY